MNLLERKVPENVEFMCSKNQYGYDKRQLTIDYKNKTYRLGPQKWASKSDIFTDKQIDEKISELKDLGFKEIKKEQEGKVYNVDSKVSEQITAEISDDIPNNANIKDKKSFEEFKTLYADKISEKCLADYGVSDDEKLLNDTAKELYLSSQHLIPSDDIKPEGDLSSKLNESKQCNVLEEDEQKDYVKFTLKSELYGTVKNDHDYTTDTNILSDIIKYYDISTYDIDTISKTISEQEDLAEYVSDYNKEINGKIKSIKLSLDKSDYKLVATIIAERDVYENEDTLNALKNYLEGQYSDGWGEGFEQQDLLEWDGEITDEFYDNEEDELYYEEVSCTYSLSISSWSSQTPTHFIVSELIEDKLTESNNKRRQLSLLDSILFWIDTHINPDDYNHMLDFIGLTSEEMDNPNLISDELLDKTIEQALAWVDEHIVEEDKQPTYREVFELSNPEMRKYGFDEEQIEAVSKSNKIQEVKTTTEVKGDIEIINYKFDEEDVEFIKSLVGPAVDVVLREDSINSNENVIDFKLAETQYIDSGIINFKDELYNTIEEYIVNKESNAALQTNNTGSTIWLRPKEFSKSYRTSKIQ